MDKLCIVVVTFKRQELLGTLFDSIKDMTVRPWRIVIVDNENAASTAEMCANFNAWAQEAWGATEADDLGGTDYMVYAPQEVNSGGSGGFSAGTELAYRLGAEWFWLMDDDVAIIPDALERMEPWMQRFDVVQGRRYDYDGGPFYWQNDFMAPLAMHNPLSKEDFNDEGYLLMTNVCFEGGMIKRSVVERIGLPDPRFFIYWDDAVYGYLASKETTCALVDEFVLRRTRDIKNWEVGSKRQLGSTSDMNRYHIMRNRGYIAKYLRKNGDYNPFAFGLGTILTLSKEGIRLAAVDRNRLSSGAKELLRGWKDARAIMEDRSWEPMPPLK